MSTEGEHGFLNISVTPIECSIVCSKSLATDLFQPAISKLSRDDQARVSISKDSYVVFSVGGAGLEAGQRVLDLTAPLAMAGIPIFFITTYYTDFILVPTSHRPAVIKALLERDFEFSESDAAYVAPASLSHSRGASTGSDPPSTPPPSNVAELQTRTFSQLRKRRVVPFVIDGLHLMQCCGREADELDGRPRSNGNGVNGGGSAAPSYWIDRINAKLYVGLLTSLASQPRFLSVTFTRDDAPSLLLDKTLLPVFGHSIDGDTTGDALVPIFLDLASLPLESTGIVCGVAGKLVEEMRHAGPDVLSTSELSYLSTARAGAVILSSEAAESALEALKPLLEDADAA